MCQASRSWRLRVPGESLYNVFKLDSSYQRVRLTAGGVAHEVFHGPRVSSDPVLGCAGDLVVNWWHSNNGARIAIDCCHLSAAGVNDDDTHGLGNEFGATTNSNGQALPNGGPFWHDASVVQGNCYGGSCTVQGNDHGTGVYYGTMLGQYSIWVGDDSVFDCPPLAPLTLLPSPGRRLSEQADPASQAVAQPPSGRSLVAADAMHELGLQVCEWAPSPIATRA
eukprot:scaffold65743_cov62-Phaeocystis_antarctica.AAC.1